MSFIPIVDKKHLKNLIAAGEIDKQTRKLNTERVLARDIGYVRDAETQRRLQQPTLEAIAESTAHAIEDAKITRKVIESASEAARASTERAIKGLVKEIKASTSTAAAPIAEIEAHPGPIVVHARGPLTAYDFKKEVVGDSGKPSGSMITPGDFVTYFGNHGATIAFSDAGNKKRIFLQRLPLTGGKQDAAGKPEEEVVEVSPAMVEFMWIKTQDEYEKFDRSRLSADDIRQFEKIRKWANYIGANDTGANSDKKLQFLRTGKTGKGLAVGGADVSSPLGDFYIDPDHWQKGKLRVRVKKGDGFVDVLKGNLDPSFVKLMSERYNPRYEYSGNGIKLYRKFVQTTGVPVAKGSGKHKLVFGPKSDVDQLRLYMASMAAGNKSTETYNKAVELADKLYELGLPDGLDKESHARLTETLAKLIAQ